MVLESNTATDWCQPKIEVLISLLNPQYDCHIKLTITKEYPLRAIIPFSKIYIVTVIATCRKKKVGNTYMKSTTEEPDLGIIVNCEVTITDKEEPFNFMVKACKIAMTISHQFMK